MAAGGRPPDEAAVELRSRGARAMAGTDGQGDTVREQGGGNGRRVAALCSFQRGDELSTGLVLTDFQLRFLGVARCVLLLRLRSYLFLNVSSVETYGAGRKQRS